MNQSRSAGADATNPGIDLGRFIGAAHLGRVALAGISLAVAVTTRDAIPGWTPVGVALACIGFIWVVGLYVQRDAVGRFLARRPGLVWVDFCVLGCLMVLDKPWDSLVAVPYGGFLLLVAYARPVQVAIATLVIAALSYLPKLVLSGVGWRYANRCPPVSAVDWLTAYVGPLFVGTIILTLCILVRGVADTRARWEGAQSAVTAAELRRAEADARRALANRLHETLSQAIRAIPLRLDGSPPDGVSERAIKIRSEIVAAALAARPVIQSAALRLRSYDVTPE